MFWGSVLWHYGIIILLAHLFAGLFPGFSGYLLSRPLFRFLLELAGLCLAMLALLGIALLVIHRLSNAKVRRVTSVMDWIFLAVLSAQVATGLVVTLSYRWGLLWYLSTAVPWFWSVAHLDPRFATITPLPWVVKFHMANGFVIIGLLSGGRVEPPREKNSSSGSGAESIAVGHFCLTEIDQ